MMYSMIDNPASCEIHNVIHLLHTRNTITEENHHAVCVVYGQNVMSEGTVRQWCRTFKNGRTNVHDQQQSGRSSVLSEDLVQSETWYFTISEL
jgi:hypothetical protein